MTEDEMVGCITDSNSMNMSLNKLQEIVKDREASCAAGLWGHKKSDTTERLSNKSGGSLKKRT